MSTQLVHNVRNLPALPVREAEVMGARILRALDRLGFTHVSEDGRQFGVCFSDVSLWGDAWVSYTVDANRLWHFSVMDLATPKVKAQLMAVTGRDVFVLTRPGLTYAIRLKDKPEVRLPERVMLDLGQCPEGDLLVPVGVGREGPVWRQLPQLGHILVAGASGSGKSTWLHTALAALLKRNDPTVLQVVLIGPKRAEFAAWLQAPHLQRGFAGSVPEAAKTLAWLVDEVGRRDAACTAALVRDIAAYNRQAARPMPYLLVVIDEAIDLAVASGERSELIRHLTRLASKARAYGVYLWLAAQHPRFDVLPRVVTANLATRITFRVQDGEAARMVGCPGAERLSRDKPGRLVARLDSRPVEMQGFYLSDVALLAAAHSLGATEALAGQAVHMPEPTRELVRYAVEQLDGRFIVGRLVEAFHQQGWTNHKVRTLAAAWEARGWLTSPAHATDARRVTPELLYLAGLDAQRPGGEAPGGRPSVS